MKVIGIIVASILILVSSTDAILNGSLTRHKPYYARVVYRLSEGDQNILHTVAGSIIADRFVLTTGAFFGISFDIRVYVGSSIRFSQQEFLATTVLRISNHPDGPAIIQLLTPLVFSHAVQSIKIIPNDSVLGMLNEQGMVLGFGEVPTQRNNLHAAFLRIVSSGDCLTSYPDRDGTAYFCASDLLNRSDFCADDSGSAFSVESRGEEYLVGMAITSPCSGIIHNIPSLFVRIAHFRELINNIINGL